MSPGNGEKAARIWRDVRATLDVPHVVRAIEMHVSNSLAKLACRSRTEAIARAGGLGFLAVDS